MAKDRDRDRRHGHAPPEEAPPETAHLDEAVTKAVVASAGFFKRYRTVLIIAAAAMLAVVVVRALYVEARDSRVEGFEAEADRLTNPDDPDAEPAYEKIADLVARSSGTLAEKDVLLAVSNYLWERRDPMALRKAREYAERAKTRFREEKDVQEWTERMLEAIQETLDFQLPAEAYGPPAPVRLEPAKKEPEKAEPAKTEPEKTEPAKVEAEKAESKKEEPAGTESAKAEAEKTEPEPEPAPEKKE